MMAFHRDDYFHGTCGKEVEIAVIQTIVDTTTERDNDDDDNNMVRTNNNNNVNKNTNENADVDANNNNIADHFDNNINDNYNHDNNTESSVGAPPDLQQNERVVLQQLAEREGRATSYLRIFVIALLVSTALLMSYFGYAFTKQRQCDAFHASFRGYATDLIIRFHLSVQKHLEIFDSLSIAITTLAMVTNQTFPYVTIPHFEVLAANTRVLSGATYILYGPLIRVVIDNQQQQLDQWNQYAWENRQLFVNSIQADDRQRAIQDQRIFATVTAAGGSSGTGSSGATGSSTTRTATNDSNTTLTTLFLNLTDQMFNFQGHTWNNRPPPLPDDPGPFLPTWHQSPAVPLADVFNFNTLSHPAAIELLHETIRTGQAALTRASTLADQSEYALTADYLRLVLSLGQFRDTSTTDGFSATFLDDPLSPMAYPVFDTLDPTTRQIAGVLQTALYWRTYFTNVLPVMARGIQCVLTNQFNQTFTYEINGADAIYRGDSDQHDPAYEYLAHSEDLNQYLANTGSTGTGARPSYTSVKLSDFSSYTITVYPTKATMLHFTSFEPYRNALVIFGIFLFVSLIFASYDCYSRRLRQILTDRAVASGAIVSSLFPSHVRDQLYLEDQHRCHHHHQYYQQEHMPPPLPLPSTRAALLFGRRDVFERDRLSSVAAPNTTTTTTPPPLSSDDDQVVIVKGYHDSNKNNNNIAELYPATTIMFADISGFTKWCKSRAPHQVFCLLETLFQAFDALAVRRKVFKVETIGDCYVCVTGLPSPQEKHAVIMARFASECLDRMRALVSSLSLCLGPETADLKLRVGLHSGPVTGGVLRGQKSRFQLFGPTMNQASRMESTGIPGRIQVSAETAQELSLYDKSHWLTERLDKIEAKGLGELTTYWVNIMESALPNKEDSTALSRLSRQQPPLPQQQQEHRRDNSPSCSDSHYGGQYHL